MGFAFTLFFLLVFYIVREKEERGWLMGLAVGAFLLKAILVPIYFEWLVSIGNLGFAYFDAGGVHDQGLQIAEEIGYDIEHTGWGSKSLDPGFYFFTAYTYLVFGNNTLVIRFILIMCISMTLLYVYRITKLYFDEKTARLAAGLQAFLPFPILLSLNHRKDPMVQLIVMFMFYHSVRVFRQEPRWQQSAVMVFLGLFAVYPFRSGLVLPFIGVMIISFMLANRNLFQGLGLTLLTVVGLLVLQVSAPEDSQISLESYAQRAEGKFDLSAQRSEAGSGLARLLRVTGFTDIYKVPIAAVAYLLLPYPPNFTERPVAILGSILNLVSVILFPHLLIGAWSMIRGPDWRSKLPLLIFPVIFLLVLGAVHIGVVRYKQIFYPVCLIWTAVGWRHGTTFFFKFTVYGLVGLIGILVYTNRYLL